MPQETKLSDLVEQLVGEYKADGTMSAEAEIDWSNTTFDDRGATAYIRVAMSDGTSMDITIQKPVH